MDRSPSLPSLAGSENGLLAAASRTFCGALAAQLAAPSPRRPASARLPTKSPRLAMSNVQAMIRRVCDALDSAASRGLPYREALALCDVRGSGEVDEREFKAWLEWLGVSTDREELDLLQRRYGSPIRYLEFLRSCCDDEQALERVLNEVRKRLRDCDWRLEEEATPNDRGDRVLAFDAFFLWIAEALGVELRAGERSQLVRRFGDGSGKILVDAFSIAVREEFAWAGRDAYARACEILRMPPSKACLKRLTNVRFDLRNSTLDGEGARALAVALAANARVTSVDLSGNGIGDEGAIAIAAQSHAQGLALQRCRLSISSLTAIARCKMLTELDLGSNRIGDAGAEILADVLPETVKALAVSNCDIGEAGGAALGAKFRFEYFDGSYNAFRSSGAEPIFWNAAKATVLLSVSYNAVGDEVADALHYLLSTSRALKHLDVESNRLGKAAGAAVADALPHNASVSTLRMGFQRLGDAAAVKVAAALAANSGIDVLAIENTSDPGGEQAVVDAAEEALRHRYKSAHVVAEHPERDRVEIPAEVQLTVWKKSHKKITVVQNRPARMLERVVRVPTAAAAAAATTTTTVVEKNATSKNGPENAGDASPACWTLEKSSVWRARPQETDSRGFYDSDEFLAKVAEYDVSQTKIVELLKNDWAEHKRVVTVVQCHFREIMKIHLLYAADGTEAPFDMQWNQWRDFVTDCEITAGEDSSELNMDAMDRVFIAASRDSKKCLSREAFVEALFRVASRKYGQQRDSQQHHMARPADAIAALLEKDILPKPRDSIAIGDDHYRRATLYVEPVDEVLQKYANLTREIWDRLTAVADRAQAEDKAKGRVNCKRRILDVQGFVSLVEDVVSLRVACLIFVFSQLCVLARSQNYEYKYLTYLEFLEALCRCSDLAVSQGSLAEKIPVVLEVISKKIALHQLFLNPSDDGDPPLHNAPPETAPAQPAASTGYETSKRQRALAVAEATRQHLKARRCLALATAPKVRAQPLILGGELHDTHLPPVRGRIFLARFSASLRSDDAARRPQKAACVVCEHPGGLRVDVVLFANRRRLATVVPLDRSGATDPLESAAALFDKLVCGDCRTLIVESEEINASPPSEDSDQSNHSSLLSNPSNHSPRADDGDNDAASLEDGDHHGSVEGDNATPHKDINNL